MAQAAASTALNKLRSHFGDPLFSRTARGMLPTPARAGLHPPLRDVMAQLDQRARRPRRRSIPPKPSGASRSA